MKITLEPYSGGQYVAHNDAEHILEVIELFKGLLVSCGYHPETVDQHLSTEGQQWFDLDDQNNTTEQKDKNEDV